MPGEHRPPALPISALVSCLLAMLLFALLDATAKHLTAFMDVPLLVWGRYLVHLLLMTLTILPGTGRQLLLTRQPAWMMLRGLSLVAVTLLGQLALQTLPLAETTALVFIAPLLVAIFAGPFLGEQLRPLNGLALLIGFVGALLIVRPGGALSGVGVVYALGAGFFYAAYQLLTRRLATSEPPLRLLFHTALFGTLAMSAVLPIAWDGRLPTPGQALLIVSLGFYGGAGHFLLIHAFRQSPASLLSPLLYMQLVWATLLGWLVFDHWPDAAAVAGMLLICIAGLSSAWRKDRRTTVND